MNQDELNQKFQIFEKQITQIQEQDRAIEQAILDLNQIGSGLDEIVGNGDSEIMAPIGRGIFVKAKLLSEKLTVDIGGGNFVTKTISETKKMIEEQSGKLKLMKKDLDKEMERINIELTKTMQEAQEVQAHAHSEEEHSCDCGNSH